MSRSSASDIEKIDAEKEHTTQNPTGTWQGQEEVIEATVPAFVEHDDNLNGRDGYGEGTELERIATTASTRPSVNNIKSVPNGGLVAWLQVLGSFFLFFNTCRFFAPAFSSRY